MARLPYPERDQLAEAHRPLLEEIQARFGRLNNIFRILAHHPILLRQVMDFGVALRHETRLDPILRELAMLTVGCLTHGDYEVTHHGALALRIGVRPEQLERLAVWERDPAFTAKERAVIRYAAEATQQVTVTSATFEALREFLDAQQLLELVLHVPSTTWSCACWCHWRWSSSRLHTRTGTAWMLSRRDMTDGPRAARR